MWMIMAEVLSVVGCGIAFLALLETSRNAREIADACIKAYVRKLAQTKRNIAQAVGEEQAETGQEAEPTGEPPKDEWLKLVEAAKLLHVDKGTVSRWADEGKIQDNGQKRKARRVSKISVLLLKDKREREDSLKDAAEVLQDEASKIPDRY
jgi:hypothetical protein